MEHQAFLRLSGPHFAKAKAISVDFAVMEHTKLAAVIPLDASWTDVGSWTSLFQAHSHNPARPAWPQRPTAPPPPGHAFTGPAALPQTCVEKPDNPKENRDKSVFEKGEVRSIDVKNCYLSTDGPLLACMCAAHHSAPQRLAADAAAEERGLWLVLLSDTYMRAHAPRAQRHREPVRGRVG